MQSLRNSIFLFYRKQTKVSTPHTPFNRPNSFPNEKIQTNICFLLRFKTGFCFDQTKDPALKSGGCVDIDKIGAYPVNVG